MMSNDLMSSKVVIFGAGSNGKSMLNRLLRYGITPAYLVDNNREIVSLEVVRGVDGVNQIFDVRSPETMLQENKSRLKIIVTPNNPYYAEIQRQLTGMGLEQCVLLEPTDVNWMFNSILNELSALRIESENTSKLNYEKSLLIKSDLFDENYYLYHYTHVCCLDIEPIEHYLTEGWKLGYNPSAIFDTKMYLSTYPYVMMWGVNPLVFFLQHGKRYCHYCYFKNPYEPSEQDIMEYLECVSSRNTKKVIYTCITGEYDDLTQQKYICPEYDYVCFTDNRKWVENGREGVWEIRPIQVTDMDNARINRYHKIHPHLLFPEYDESIYIDANINVLTRYLFDVLNAKCDNNFAFPKHFRTECCIEESKQIKIHFPELAESIDKQIEMIQSDGFPMNYGMSENNILYRHHHDYKLIRVMDEWWYMVKNYCKRDQTSLAYVMWKNGLNMKEHFFQNARMDLKNYAFINHSKDYERKA